MKCPNCGMTFGAMRKVGHSGLQGLVMVYDNVRAIRGPTGIMSLMEWFLQPSTKGSFTMPGFKSAETHGALPESL